MTQQPDDAGLCVSGGGVSDILILVCSRALDAAGDDPVARAILLERRGRARLASKRTEAALADFEAALRLNPVSAAAYDGRGLARVAGGDETLALADFEAAIRLSPTYAAAYRNRGILHFTAHRFAAAIADYDRALAYNRHQPEIYVRRAVAHFLTGAAAAAVQDLNTTAAYRFDYGYGALWHAAALAESGGSGSEAILRDQAAELEPDEWPGALIALYQGAGDEAAVQRAVAAVPARHRDRIAGDAHFYIGLYRRLHDQPEAAATAFRQAIAAGYSQSLEHAAARALLHRGE